MNFSIYLRWVIESCNGHLKNWKTLGQVFPNKQIPNIGDYVRIVCALCNAFKAPCVFDKSNDVSKAKAMKEQLHEKNKLQELIEAERLSTRRIIYEPVTAESITDFPKLSMEDL